MRDTVCADRTIALLLSSVCDENGDTLKDMASADFARIPALAAYPNGEGGQVVYPTAQRTDQYADLCTVSKKDLQMVRTDRLWRRLAPPGRVQAADNWFVKTVLDDILDGVDLPVSMGQGAGAGGDAAGSGEEDPGSAMGGEAVRGGVPALDAEGVGALFSVLSNTTEKCGLGFQCEVSVELMDVLLQRYDSEPERVRAGLDPFAVIPGRCADCPSGMFCPPGTVNDGSAGIFGGSTLNLCPPGYFCPTPDEIKDCPVGYFCPPGSVQAYPCNDLDLNSKETVSQGIDASLKGNYCPGNAIEPWGLCPGGSFCPNASIAITCPAGSYCPEQATAPLPCPLLSACGPGRSAPTTSWIALIGMASIVLVLASFFVGFQWRLKRKQRRVEARSQLNQRKEAVMKALCQLCLPKMDPQTILQDVVIQGFAATLGKNTVKVQVQRVNIALKDKVVLNDVSVDFLPGTLNAVFGPSGAGKTTLIRSITGKLAPGMHPSGRVAFKKSNGEEVRIYDARVSTAPARQAQPIGGCGLSCCLSRKAKAARRAAINMGVGYVPQDNVVYNNLTVHENINYSAKLRLRHIDNAAKKAIVRDTLAILGLTRIQHSLVGNSFDGGISGGEARRVSIGLELAACPPVLILDEPTTGLDAVSANDVVACLQKMSRLGITIAASLHQPRFSIFQLFDNVHILKKGGMVVYSGSKDAVLPYFKTLGFTAPAHDNPADFLLDVAAGMVDRRDHPEFTPQDLVGLWEEQFAVMCTVEFDLLVSPRHGSGGISPRNSRGSGSWGGGGGLSPRNSLRMSPRSPRQGGVESPRSARRQRCFSPRGSPYNIVSGKVNTIYWRNFMAEGDDLAGSRDVSRSNSLSMVNGLSPRGVTLNLPSRLSGQEAAAAAAAAMTQPQLDDVRSPSSADVYSPESHQPEVEDSPWKEILIDSAREGDEDTEEEDRHNYIVAVAQRFLVGKEVPSSVGEASEALEAICTGVWRQGVLPDMEVAEELIVSNILAWTGTLQAEDREELLEAMRAARDATSPSGSLRGTGESSGDSAEPLARNDSIFGRSAGSHAALLKAGGRSATRAPGCLDTAQMGFQQMHQLLGRDAITWFRDLGTKVIDLGTIAVAAVILGFSQGSGQKEVNEILTSGMLCTLFLGMLSVVWAMDFINRERANANREAGGGVNTVALYTSKVLQNTFIDSFLRPLIFTILFYHISLPRQTFLEFFLVMFGTALSCSGLGYFIAVLVPPQSATIVGLIVAFTFGGVLNGFSPYLASLPSPWIAFPSYARGGVEALALKEFRAYNDWGIDYGMVIVGYDYNNYPWDIVWLYASAIVLRVLAFPFYRRIVMQ
jgi:ABC-type multidrug transport system ATPase subunit